MKLLLRENYGSCISILTTWPSSNGSLFGAAGGAATLGGPLPFFLFLGLA